MLIEAEVWRQDGDGPYVGSLAVENDTEGKVAVHLRDNAGEVVGSAYVSPVMAGALAAQVVAAAQDGDTEETT